MYLGVIVGVHVCVYVCVIVGVHVCVCLLHTLEVTLFISTHKIGL